MKKNIKLTAFALRAIINLQHSNGTYRYYADTLSRLITFVLHQSDEIGMSDCEAMATLRALHSLREDLGHIAGSVAESGQVEIEADDDPEDVAARVEAIFEVSEESDDVQNSNYRPVDKLDEPREMLKDIGVAYQRTKHLQGVISEAITHATNAGEKYDCVVSDLNDLNCDLEKVEAQLDALMAINPETFEPKKLTYTDYVIRNVNNAIDALATGKEYLDEALEGAKRSDILSETVLRRIEATSKQIISAIKEAPDFSIKANNADDES